MTSFDLLLTRLLMSPLTPSMSRPPHSCPGTAPARSPSTLAAVGLPGRRPPTARTPPLSDAPRAPRLCFPTARCPLKAGPRHRAPRSTCSRMRTAAWSARPRHGPAPSTAPAAPSAVRPPRGPDRARSASRVPPRPSTSWAAPAPRVAAPWWRGPRPSSRSAGPRHAPRPQPTTRSALLGAPCWARAAALSPRLCALKVNPGPYLGDGREAGQGPASRYIPTHNFSPDDLTLRRRTPKAWNESDLDVAYEKKSSQTASYEREWWDARGAGGSRTGVAQSLMSPALQVWTSSRGLLRQACSCYPGEKAAWTGWGPPAR